MANLLSSPRQTLSSLLTLLSSPSNVIIAMTQDVNDHHQTMIFDKIEEKSKVVLRVLPLQSGYS